MRDPDSGKNPRAIVRFRTIAHFFDADDPAPESNRELSDRAEDEIFKTVIDAPEGSKSPICTRIELQFPATDLSPARCDAIVSALRNHFRRRSVELKRDRRLTARVGFREFRLTVAIVIPSVLGMSVLLRFYPHEPFAVIAVNILTIFCWVVIWQPFQSLVFDRWTQAEESKIYGEIAGMEITVVPVE
jgi:hypothetical protein